MNDERKDFWKSIFRIEYDIIIIIVLCNFFSFNNVEYRYT